MAMYEQRGYCPAHSIFLYKLENRNRVSELWERTWEVLGDRISFMVYSNHGAAVGGGYILEVLMGEEGTLGLEVATALSMLMPTCNYKAKEGRPIVITDYPDLSKLIFSISEENGKHYTTQSEILLPTPDRHCMRRASICSFEDKRFLVILIDDQKEILMRIHKK